VKLLSTARDLRRRRARERSRLFVAEGVRAVEELLASPLTLRGAIVTEDLDGTPRGRALRAALASAVMASGADLLTVDDATFQTAAGTESPQGVLAIGTQPERSFASFPAVGPIRIVVLDGVQDPGNAGTIIRSAAALGASGAVSLPGTVDLWSPKVVRSAMGVMFHFAAFAASPPQLLEWSSRTATQLWSADAAGDPVPVAGQLPPRIALVVGNEGAGLSPQIAAHGARSVAIPLAPGVESLNVAVATGILLHALRPAVVGG